MVVEEDIKILTDENIYQQNLLQYFDEK